MTSYQPIILPAPVQPPIASDARIDILKSVLAQTPDVLFAVLVGSRAQSQNRTDSDWDIAVYWEYSDSMKRIEQHEILRHQLAKALAESDSNIDLIDIRDARLAMRALIAEEGFILQVNNELAWARFLTRTWRELEDFYWERQHAA
jgi:predicted nucleotidyltransferase